MHSSQHLASTSSRASFPREGQQAAAARPRNSGLQAHLSSGNNGICRRTAVRFSNGRKVSSFRRVVPVCASGLPLEPFLDGQFVDLASASAGLNDAALNEAAAHAASLMYTIADAVASVDVDVDAAATSESSAGWLAPIADRLEDLLKYMSKSLSEAGVDNATGWSIFGLTLFVKILTYPLTKKQVESSMAQQNLAPMIKAIKKRYPNDKDKVNAETARVYEAAGVNPLAGCLPSLATLPIFWGLYRALLDASKDDSGLFNQSFYFIPDLAGPTTQEKGMAWLLPLDVNNAPPIGWEAATPYLTLSILIVVAQLVSQELIKQPETGEETDSQKNTLLLIKLLPFMIGWFSLNVPAGLGLYWLSNTVLTTATQAYLRFGGGAQPIVSEKMMAPKIKLGTAIRSSTLKEAPPLATTEDAATTVEAPRVVEKLDFQAMVDPKLPAMPVSAATDDGNTGIEAAALAVEPAAPAAATSDFGDDLPSANFGAPADFGVPADFGAPAAVTSTADTTSEAPAAAMQPASSEAAVLAAPPQPQGPELKPYAIEDLTLAVASCAATQKTIRSLTVRRCKRQRRPASPVTANNGNMIAA